MSEKIIKAIRDKLKETAPKLTREQEERRAKILNSTDPEFMGYGHKVADLEKLVRELQNSFESSYEEALEVFSKLMRSHVHEEKFAAFLFLNRFKRYFDEKIVHAFKEAISEHCDSWAVCDSSMIKVLGPFLAKEKNDALALKTIEDWSNSEEMWLRRASMVILLKITMIKKHFDEAYIFSLVEKLLEHSEDYVQKGIGWLLKTCSRYKPSTIERYLIKNKEKLPRLILRYASEKLSKESRAKILKK